MAYLITLSVIKRKGIDPFLIKTIKSEGDVYLDELITGQYLVSFANFPKTIHTELPDAIHSFEVICKKHN